MAQGDGASIPCLLGGNAIPPPLRELMRKPARQLPRFGARRRCPPALLRDAPTNRLQRPVPGRSVCRPLRQRQPRPPAGRPRCPRSPPPEGLPGGLWVRPTPFLPRHHPAAGSPQPRGGGGAGRGGGGPSAAGGRSFSPALPPAASRGGEAALEDYARRRRNGQPPPPAAGQAAGHTHGMSDGGFLPGHRFGKARPALLPACLPRGPRLRGGRAGGTERRAPRGAFPALPEGKPAPVGGSGAASRRWGAGQPCVPSPRSAAGCCEGGTAAHGGGLTAGYLWAVAKD